MGKIDTKSLASKLGTNLGGVRTDNILRELQEKLIKELIGRLRSEETALVLSVIPLNEEEERRISEIFSNLLEKPIKIENLIDKKLLGGFKVIIGDWKFDASLSYLLKNLKEDICQI